MRPLLAVAACVLPTLLPPPLRAEEVPPDDETVLRAANVPTDGPGLIAFFRQRTLTDEKEGTLLRIEPVN